jgi:hypothetical protein
MDKGTLFKSVTKGVLTGIELGKSITQKQKSVWDDRLYKIAIKKYKKLTNVGWYKLFLSPLDYVHDQYFAYISNVTNFENAETFEDYFIKFNNRVFSYSSVTYRNTTKIGQEYLNRFSTYNIETDWDKLEKNYFEQPTFGTLDEALKDYSYAKRFYDGYSYIEIAKSENISPVLARKRTLKQFSLLKKDSKFNELIDR